MPIYSYQHPNTKEIFDDIRKIVDRENPFIAPDGVECSRVWSDIKVAGWVKGREVFEADPDYVKKCKPKYVKFQDGHRELYNPNTHF